MLLYLWLIGVVHEVASTAETIWRLVTPDFLLAVDLSWEDRLWKGGRCGREGTADICREISFIEAKVKMKPVV